MKLSMKYTRLLLVAGVVLTALTGCGKDDQSLARFEPEVTDSLAKGADVSWLTEMEASGVKFYSSSGVEMDCMKLLKNLGMNSIRLRVWVNPANGWNNTQDVLVKALRAHYLGMRLMIDFHYSDVWADPGQQTKPAAWEALNFSALKEAVYTHTRDVMNTLMQNGITPEWVQVGNETNDGMLWEDGRASANMKNFAELVEAGYSAVKEVSSTSKVIVHLSNGYNNSLFRWMFDGLKANGARWDVIGMSLYPTADDWQTLSTQCLANMNDMAARYGTEVMVCEVGMPVSEPEAAKAFLTDMIAKVRSVPGGRGLGVLYWEPQSYNDWKGYKLGAFDSSGRPTAALDAFQTVNDQ